MKLYRVTVEIEMFVVAVDQNSAEEIARYEVGGGDGGFEVLADAVPIEKLNDIPEEWRKALPYGLNPEEEEKVCADWVKP